MITFAHILLWASLILVVHSYVFYPIIVLVWSFVKKESVLSSQSELPSVSLILSVYNEEKVIVEKLKNIATMDYPKEKIEILVGSDCSNDSTIALARSVSLAGIRILSFDKRRGKAAVLNDLASRAKNEILVFSDANTFYAADALRKLVRHFGDPSIGGVCGNLQLKASAENSGGKGEAAYWHYENFIKESEGKIKTTFGATGGIYALRRGLFRLLPTNKAVMDDFLLPLFAVQQGFRVVYDAVAVGWEETTASTVSEFQRKIRIGAANFNGIREILPLFHPKNGFVSFGLISHKLIRWLVPFLLLIIFITSIFLLSQGALYRSLFFAQCIFGCLAGIGSILDKKMKPVMFFTMPYYFIVANFALLLGFVRFVRGTQKVAWNATRM